MLGVLILRRLYKCCPNRDPIAFIRLFLSMQLNLFNLIQIKISMTQLVSASPNPSWNSLKNYSPLEENLSENSLTFSKLYIAPDEEEKVNDNDDDNHFPLPLSWETLIY